MRAASKSSGSDAKAMAENPSHVRFIVETGFLGYFSDGVLSVLKLLSSLGDTQVSDITANRLVKVAAKGIC